MNAITDRPRVAYYENGTIVVTMNSGEEIRFPAAQNPRLAQASPSQLNNIQISPFGLHWPDLDEDLSFRGMLNGDFGQAAIKA
jgi:hypothetical protein